jgi:radical SAM protein with 4Fe4S-binding SPASM domain
MKILSALGRHLPERIKSPLELILATVRQLPRWPKAYRDLALSTPSAILKSGRAFGRPVHLTIEPTNTCDLRCPVCETGSGIMRRPKGHMSLDDFKSVIDKLAGHVNILFFYFMGEPFLNKDAYAMIKYASQRGIFVSTCTNGHFVDPKAVIESGIGEISFQIGGMTQETHGIYRVRGNLRKTLDNLVATIEEKKKHPESQTKISLGFIVMKHNEHEIEDFLKFAKEAGVDEAEVIAPCVRTLEQGRELIPQDDKYWLYDREAFEKGILRPKLVPDNRCDWLYYSTTIQWNGDVVPCCRDTQGDVVMGNIFKQDFGEIWNGKKYKSFRKKVGRDQKNLELCRLCSGYRIPTLH